MLSLSYKKDGPIFIGPQRDILFYRFQSNPQVSSAQLYWRMYSP